MLALVTNETLIYIFRSNRNRRGPTDPKELAKASHFISFILAGLSSKELQKIRIIVYFQKKIFIDLKLSGLKQKIIKLARAFPYPVELMIGKFERLPSKAVVLYGQYIPPAKERQRKLLIFWEAIKPDSKRVLFNKRLFGYTHSGKFYSGLLQKYGGQKLGKGCIIVPLVSSAPFIELFEQMAIPFRTKEVQELG